MTASLAGRQGKKDPGVDAPQPPRSSAGGGDRRAPAARLPQDGSRSPGVGMRAGACHGPELQPGIGVGVGFGVFVCFTYGSHERQGTYEFCTSGNSLSYGPPM